MDEIMTTQEVASYLRVPRATVYAWNTRGGGPKYLRVGKHARYRRSDVDAWLERQAVSGGQAA